MSDNCKPCGQSWVKNMWMFDILRQKKGCGPYSDRWFIFKQYHRTVTGSGPIMCRESELWPAVGKPTIPLSGGAAPHSKSCGSHSVIPDLSATASSSKGSFRAERGAKMLGWGWQEGSHVAPNTQPRLGDLADLQVLKWKQCDFQLTRTHKRSDSELFFHKVPWKHCDLIANTSNSLTWVWMWSKTGTRYKEAKYKRSSFLT